MIFRGPYENVTIPEVPLTSFVLQRAAALGNKAALIEGPTGRIVTYAKLAESIRRVAASLAARGFAKGEVFGILSPNVPEYAIAFHGVALLGGIITPINPLYTEREIAHQLKDAGAKFLVTGPQFIDKARAAAEAASERDVVPRLRALGCSAERARHGAELCADIPDAPLEERVKVALRGLAPCHVRRAAYVGASRS